MKKQVKEKPPKVSASAKCEVELWEKFKKVADADKRSAASLIHKLISDAVARYEQAGN